MEIAFLIVTRECQRFCCRDSGLGQDMESTAGETSVATCMLLHLMATDLACTESPVVGAAA